jgi:ADP-ribosyl-[dinitrogen reductase] hydrolase
MVAAVESEVLMMKSDILARAEGVMLGQLAGDALGSLVEFQRPEQIRGSYPDGVRDLADGGTWNTIAGQPTDDSEMALLLARMLVREGRYSQTAALEAYRFWLSSSPFDCGATIARGLRGAPDPQSQANGAMMRASPIGIFGADKPLSLVGGWAAEDAALTHPNQLCQQANSLYCMAIAHAISSGCGPDQLYHAICNWAEEEGAAPALIDSVTAAATERPASYTRHQGWVLTAFHNALWQLLHADSLESAVIDSVMQGGDTDTNAAICGALLGAVHGIDALPERWQKGVLECRPDSARPAVRRPRPDCLWPVDALELTASLVKSGA